MSRTLVAGDCGRRKCKHCGELYQADVRNRHHQRYCGKEGCRRASKRAAQDRWLRSEKGRGYFRGPENVARVREWRATHPGYSRRKAGRGALQDLSTTQLVDKQGVVGAAPGAGDLVPSPLQDLMTPQPALLIGLIASLTGSTLQDDIAKTTRRFIHSGKDILGCRR